MKFIEFLPWEERIEYHCTAAEQCKLAHCKYDPVYDALDDMFALFWAKNAALISQLKHDYKERA